MRARTIVYGCLAILALAAPFLGLYPVFLMKLLCFAMFACAFNLLLGYTKMLSFGHAAYFGSSAYVTGWLVTPGTGPPGSSPGAADGLAEAARRVLNAEVNPAIAAHRGHVTVTGAEHGWIRIRLEGGCQGCSLAEVTIRQGIEPLLRARLPAVTGLTDVTDHEAGTDPFFSPEKR